MLGVIIPPNLKIIKNFPLFSTWTKQGTQTIRMNFSCLGVTCAPIFCTRKYVESYGWDKMNEALDSIPRRKSQCLQHCLASRSQRTFFTDWEELCCTLLQTPDQLILSYYSLGKYVCVHLRSCEGVQLSRHTESEFAYFEWRRILLQMTWKNASWWVATRLNDR